jgi:CxxC motif-containing protein
MEFTNDVEKDILTTLVRIKGAECKVVSVKSSKPIDKSKWIECSKCLSGLYVGVPIKIGDVVCSNILNTGADMVSTKNILNVNTDKIIKH